MAEIIDISPEIHSKIAVWPGDTSFSQRFLCSFKGGGNLDLSTIETTVHLGAHTDAPSHYSPQGDSIEKRDLSYYYGSAQVISVQIKRGERIYPKDISHPIQSPRILLATNSFPDPDRFNEDFCSLSPELVEWLAEKNVCLVGIDTPSIDPFSSKKLESHNAVFKKNMAVLEGIVLSHVTEGLYTLIAFPLKIRGSDASPVRAVLIRYGHTCGT
ncbi:MAG: cyclase family protein [Bdellovibrionales bacterium]|nr:cyclase family protein [Bdellovibrionales bacterium]